MFIESLKCYFSKGVYSFTLSTVFIWSVYSNIIVFSIVLLLFMFLNTRLIKIWTGIKITASTVTFLHFELAICICTGAFYSYHEKRNESVSS